VAPSDATASQLLHRHAAKEGEEAPAGPEFLAKLDRAAARLRTRCTEYDEVLRKHCGGGGDNGGAQPFGSAGNGAETLRDGFSENGETHPL